MATASAPRYDHLGEFYARHRRPDARIARQIEAALGDARRIVDVGAGSGSYEPADRQVVALEPSTVMMAQRRQGAHRAVRGVAELLPFASGAFDAAMVVLSLHHWSDKQRGLTELCRVARRRVVLCFDVTLEHDFWLEREYLPEIRTLDYGGYLSPEEVSEALGGGHIEVVPVPWDCADGFLGAYWRRPEAYLDDSVRACISGIARLHPTVVRQGMERLEGDLQTGRWHERHGDLLRRTELDVGYRLVVSDQ